MSFDPNSQMFGMLRASLSDDADRVVILEPLELQQRDDFHSNVKDLLRVRGEAEEATRRNLLALLGLNWASATSQYLAIQSSREGRTGGELWLGDFEGGPESIAHIPGPYRWPFLRRRFGRIADALISQQIPASEWRDRLANELLRQPMASAFHGFLLGAHDAVQSQPEVWASRRLAWRDLAPDRELLGLIANRSPIEFELWAFHRSHSTGSLHTSVTACAKWTVSIVLVPALIAWATPRIDEAVRERDAQWKVEQRFRTTAWSCFHEGIATKNLIEFRDTLRWVLRRGDSSSICAEQLALKLIGISPGPIDGNDRPELEVARDTFRQRWRLSSSAGPGHDPYSDALADALRGMPAPR